MDFSLTDNQSAIRDSVIAYLAGNYRFADRAASLANFGGLDPRRWKEIAELGWFGVELPEDVGGAGGSLVEMSLLMEELGRFLVAEPVLFCGVLPARVLYRVSQDRIGKEHVNALIRGDAVFGLALAEPGKHGNVRSIDTVARRAGHGYVIEGRKSLVIGGPRIDHFIVSATIRDGADVGTPGLFSVRSDNPDVQRRDFGTIDGSRASELWLRDSHVEESALLTQGAPCVDLLDEVFEAGVIGVSAEAVGGMQAVISLTSEYLKIRQAFGRTLSSFQALQHRLADMMSALELSKSLLYRGLMAARSESRTDRLKAASAMKYFIGRHGRFVAGCAIQLHGGIGMSDEHSVGHYFKRLSMISSLLGGSEYHLSRYCQLP